MPESFLVLHSAVEQVSYFVPGSGDVSDNTNWVLESSAVIAIESTSRCDYEIPALGWFNTQPSLLLHTAPAGTVFGTNGMKRELVDGDTITDNSRTVGPLDNTHSSHPHAQVRKLLSSSSVHTSNILLM